MKLIFASAEDRAIVENIRPYRTAVECKDGHHHCAPGTVWRDRSKRLPPLMLVWHGVQPPEGEDWSMEAAERAWVAQETHKVFRQHLKVSRAWVRFLIKWLVVFGKVVIVTVALGMAATLIYGLVVVLSS